MLVASWDHVEHPMYALMEAEIVHVDLLAELADDYGCLLYTSRAASSCAGHFLDGRAALHGYDECISRVFCQVSDASAGAASAGGFPDLRIACIPVSARKPARNEGV